MPTLHRTPQMTKILITSQNADEDEVHSFVTDASSIGLTPGQWPEFIPTTLGNGFDLLISGYDREGGELRGVRYSQHLGCIEVLVINGLRREYERATCTSRSHREDSRSQGAGPASPTHEPGQHSLADP